MTPDLKKLQAIRGELSDLGDAGHLTRAEFDRLYALAKAAANDEDEYLEGIETVALRYGVALSKRGSGDESAAEDLLPLAEKRIGPSADWTTLGPPAPSARLSSHVPASQRTATERQCGSWNAS